MKYLLATAAVIATLGMASADDRQQVLAYTQAWAVEESNFAIALKNTTLCNDQDIAQCGRYLFTATLAVKAYEKSLDGVFVPACLQASDRMFKHALEQFDRVFYYAKHAIDHNDPVSMKTSQYYMPDAIGAMKETARLNHIAEVECVK
jgi:hypothetical protein